MVVQYSTSRETEQAKSGWAYERRFERAKHGMFVIEPEGPKVKDSPIGWIVRSSGFDQIETNISEVLFGKGSANLEIDADYATAGAFVFKTVDEGLLAARIRMRPEQGEGTRSQAFKVADVFLVPGVTGWATVPHNFFFTAARLKADPPVEGSATRLAPKLIDTSFDSVNWAEHAKTIRKNGEMSNLLGWMLIASRTTERSTALPPLSDDKPADPKNTLMLLQAVAILHRGDPELRELSVPVNVVLGLKARGRGPGAMAFFGSAKRPKTREASASNIIVALGDAIVVTRKRWNSVMSSRVWPTDASGRELGFGAIDVGAVATCGAPGI